LVLVKNSSKLEKLSTFWFYFPSFSIGPACYVSKTWPFTAGLANYQMELEKVGLAPETIHNIMGGTVASWINL
jgi:hypothetical protein